MQLPGNNTFHTRLQPNSKDDPVYTNVRTNSSALDHMENLSSGSYDFAVFNNYQRHVFVIHHYVTVMPTLDSLKPFYVESTCTFLSKSNFLQALLRSQEWDVINDRDINITQSNGCPHYCDCWDHISVNIFHHFVLHAVFPRLHPALC